MLRESTAVIADVHGNSWALDAVLADIARQGIQRIADLGDSVYGPLDPAGTARRLMAAGIPSILGNEDRILLVPPSELEASTLQYTRDSLPAEALGWLRSLPRIREVDAEMLACHGTPDSDQTYLLEDVSSSGVSLRTGASILRLLGTDARPVILCGHSHVARTVWLPEGILIVNPGSVGLQAYTDETPLPHRIEAGSPHARYAVLRRRAERWQVEHHTVPYAWDLAAACARKHGRPDWAQWLATGRA